MLSLQFKNLSSVSNRLSSSLSTLSLWSLSSTRWLMEGTMLETKSKSESKSKLISFSRLNSSASLLFHHSFSSIPLLCDETLPESGSRPKSLHPKDKAYLAAVIPKRIRMFESIKAKQMEEQSRIGGEAIKITLQDGVVREGKKWITTPMDVAQEMAKSLASNSLISQVNGVLWDMFRPLEFDCELKFFTFDSDEGRDTFWHSSAHILGQSLEMEYGCKLCIGPCTTRGEGFYYDAFYGELGLNEDQLKQIESGAIKAVAEKQPFERIEVSREQAMELFSENKFKVELIKDLPENTTITVYRCGPLVDLCRGPHIPNTSFVKAFTCLKTSSAYWRGNKDRESLQRVSGISYPDSKHLKEYLTQLEEAMKYDHRKLGLKQKLFFFHPLSPGSPFFLKHGTRIYNRLIDFVKSQYKERGYHEVMSPNIYNMKLWETSGHAANYKENMFTMKIESQEFGLKPMNCPGHCLLFDCRGRSYSELPLRLADFGVLHRNEASGALSGLTRVRRFQQDDAHIFCREYQIKDEVRGVLDFIKYVYDVFGFTFELDLSTRPKNYMGDIETWDKAEAALSEALDELGIPWKINEGDGAFYGPKIDIGIFDALKRKFQCATVQLDFQLPQPFDLSYSTEDEAKRERPVLIHRAILGSVERMLAILLEHYKGKWPFWLSPRQAIVCPVSVKSQAYALKVRDQIDHAGFFVEIDTTDRKINKKVREAQLAQYNYILVVGEKEEEQGQVSVRERDKGDHSVMSIEELLKLFKEEVAVCLKVSSAYAEGNKNRESLHRIYGISYPYSKRLKEYLTQLEETNIYDHRQLGLQQELFFFDPLSPGSAFFLPHGTLIFNKLMDFIRTQCKKRGYDEVSSPYIYNMKLWETSGHVANYKENMFTFPIDNEEFGIKPRNCPGHCLVFANEARSYRELPLRLVDFGVLHQNEACSELTELTRVWRFQQDDGVIFCRESQVKDEVRGVLDFIRYAYDVFGLRFELELSIRPKEYKGNIETWDKAEAALREALDEFGRPWKIIDGGGSVNGPRIDICVLDALKRKFKGGALELNLQLPQQFDLSYSGEDETKRERPVMIHRTILGSFERVFAILLEHYKGKWPFWLSPRQTIVSPVSEKFQEYAIQVCDQIHDAGFRVALDAMDRKINKEHPNGNYPCVVIDPSIRAEIPTLGAREKTRRLKKFIRISKPFLVALQETKCDDVSEWTAKQLWGAAGCDFRFKPSSVEGGGGLFTSWDPERVRLVNHQVGSFTLTTEFIVIKDGSSLVVTNCYGPTRHQEKAQWWAELDALGSRYRDSWAILGDFNAVRSQKNGTRRTTSTIQLHTRGW